MIIQNDNRLILADFTNPTTTYQSMNIQTKLNNVASIKIFALSGGFIFFFGSNDAVKNKLHS